jgi:hypothetical protein
MNGCPTAVQPALDTPYPATSHMILSPAWQAVHQKPAAIHLTDCGIRNIGQDRVNIQTHMQPHTPCHALHAMPCHITCRDRAPPTRTRQDKIRSRITHPNTHVTDVYVSNQPKKSPIRTDSTTHNPSLGPGNTQYQLNQPQLPKHPQKRDS